METHSSPVGVQETKFIPPHTIILVPVQTVVCKDRPLGEPIIDMGCQESLAGLYLPSSLVSDQVLLPPHTSISAPLHTAVAPLRDVGAPTVESGRHVSVRGS